jgi:hypothetical protein
LVTGAIATGERCDGFDYQIYHRFHRVHSQNVTFS